MGTKKSNIISLIFAAVGIQLVFCAINGSFNLVFSAFILLGTIAITLLFIVSRGIDPPPTWDNPSSILTAASIFFSIIFEYKLFAFASKSHIL